MENQAVKKGGFRFQRSQLCIPYSVFLLLFVILPLLIIVYYAFTAKDGSFSLDNFSWFFSESTNIINLLRSMLIGLITTVLCLLIGYPVAYVLSRMKTNKNFILLMLFLAPMCINFVLRAMAMRELLKLIGLMGTGTSDTMNFVNTVIGMVYDYMPFMIMPLFTVLSKSDRSLEEAALDLGANRVNVFMKVTLPLSVSGIVSGITMVFLPTMTCYVISDTYGNFKVSIVGKLIESCFRNNELNLASVIALVLLVIMFLVTLFTGRFTKNEERGGTNL